MFDHRGSGASPAALGPLTTSRMAADALAVLDELGIKSAHVYGVSLGGMVAQELALAAPDRVKALILGATTAGGFEAYPRTLGTALGALLEDRRVPVEFSSTTWRGVLTQAWAATTHDTGGRLGRVDAPTLVVHGGDDRLLPVVNGRALARLIPQAEFRVIDGAGHFYAFNVPTRASTIVRGWLDTLGDVPVGNPPRCAAFGRISRTLSSPLRLVRWQLAAVVQFSRSITT
jgi:3-oxoadipate enol-lactonase